MRINKSSHFVDVLNVVLWQINATIARIDALDVSLNIANQSSPVGSADCEKLKSKSKEKNQREFKQMVL